MNSESSPDRFENVTSVIREPLKFKAKLDIGEDAYASLRLKKNLLGLWDTAGAAATGAAVAQSSMIASTFFAPTGIWAALGLGAAVTPVGWVAAAGVISAGAWYGLARYLKDSSNSRVTVIPHFINTPIDTLALGLFDLLAPLAMKIAYIDGEIVAEEKTVIKNYLINEWGFDEGFVSEGLLFVEENLGKQSIKALATTLAEFKKQNPDCNYTSMTNEIIRFLTEVCEADGVIDEREEMAIERIVDVFYTTGKMNLPDIARDGFSKVIKTGVKGKDVVKQGLGKVKSLSAKINPTNKN